MASAAAAEAARRIDLFVPLSVDPRASGAVDLGQSNDLALRSAHPAKALSHVDVPSDPSAQHEPTSKFESSHELAGVHQVAKKGKRHQTWTEIRSDGSKVAIRTAAYLDARAWRAIITEKAF